jgi:hypothetical protein
MEEAELLWPYWRAWLLTTGEMTSRSRREKVRDLAYLCTLSMLSHLPRSLMITVSFSRLDSQLQWAYYEGKSNGSCIMTRQLVWRWNFQ